jgi:tRNA A37 N6-isopentenylltransferase MiaA
MKPCKINPEMIENLKECIKIGMSYSATSAALNISEDTFYSYMRKGREGKAPYAAFFGAVRESEAQLMKDCLTRLRKVADMGNMDSIKFILERRFPKDWGKSDNVNIKAQMESVNVNVNASPTEEEKEKIRARIIEKLTPKNRVIIPEIE